MRGDIQPLDLIFFADTQFDDQVTALRPARLSTPGIGVILLTARAVLWLQSNPGCRIPRQTVRI